MFTALILNFVEFRAYLPGTIEITIPWNDLTFPRFQSLSHVEVRRTRGDLIDIFTFRTERASRYYQPITHYTGTAVASETRRKDVQITLSRFDKTLATPLRPYPCLRENKRIIVYLVYNRAQLRMFTSDKITLLLA